MPDMDPPVPPEAILPTDVRTEGERLREHMTICAERIRRDIYALIDAIELMKYIDRSPVSTRHALKSRGHASPPPDLDHLAGVASGLPFSTM